MKRWLFVLILVLSARQGFAQPAPNRAAAVQQILASLPAAVESPTDEARRSVLYEIARRLNAQGDCCWGVLVKTDQGNKIPGDILVWRPTLEHFDVMTGGVAAATWIPKGQITNAAWIWQAADAASPEPSPTPQPVPTPVPTPVPVPTVDLSAVLSRLEAIYQQNERIYADETNQHRDQTAAIMASVNNPGWFASLMGNRYVQLAIAAVGTYYTTRQMTK